MSECPQNETTIGSLVDDISAFTASMDHVVAIQVSYQQKRTAMFRSLRSVAEADDALVKEMRKARNDDTALGWETLLSLFDACQSARDHLGPLEVEFEEAEFRLVPQEDVLIDMGKEIKNKYEALPSTMPSSSPDAWPKISVKRPVASQHFDDSPVTIPKMEGNEDQLTPLDHAHTGPPSIVRAQLSSHGPSNRHQRQELEPSVQLFAPDLIQRPPWTQWSQFNEPYSKDELSPYVQPEDHYRDGGSDADIVGDDGLLLGNSIRLQCPFLRNVAGIKTSHDLVNIWLLYGLRTSRLEVVRLRRAVEEEMTGAWEFADTMRFWNCDEAATTRTPLGSDCGSDVIDKAAEDLGWSSAFGSYGTIDPYQARWSGKTLSWYSREESFLQSLQRR